MAYVITSISNDMIFIDSYGDTNPDELIGKTISIGGNYHLYNYCKITGWEVVNKYFTLESSLPNDFSLRTDNSNHIWCTELPNIGVKNLGYGSSAIGYDCKATYQSNAFGYGTNAYGRFGFAEGYSSQAGYAAHAQNKNTIASGNVSHAGGDGAIASGEGAFVHGTINAIASGKYSVVLGVNSTASAEQSISIGAGNNVSGIHSKTIGHCLNSSGVQQTVLGRFNNDNSNYTFIVGTGKSDSERENALEFRYNEGNIFGHTITPSGIASAGTVTAKSAIYTDDKITAMKDIYSDNNITAKGDFYTKAKITSEGNMTANGKLTANNGINYKGNIVYSATPVAIPQTGGSVYAKVPNCYLWKATDWGIGDGTIMEPISGHTYLANTLLLIPEV